MKIILFGGTFDPPHIGHVNILANFVFTINPDLVVIMPTGTPPHKQASTTPTNLRVEMCQCFLPLFENTQISNYEIAREGKSFTYDSVMHVKSQYPGAEVYLIIGSDMFLSLGTWHRVEDLIQEVVLMVQPRREDDELPVRWAIKDWEQKGARIMFSGIKEPISSGLIRAGIAAGQDLYAMIPPPADEIVRWNRLYQNAARHQT